MDCVDQITGASVQCDRVAKHVIEEPHDRTYDEVHKMLINIGVTTQITRTVHTTPCILIASFPKIRLIACSDIRIITQLTQHTTTNGMKKKQIRTNLQICKM